MPIDPGPTLPPPAALAALRAWCDGMTARASVARFMGQTQRDGRSSRYVLGNVRRQLASYARARHRDDLGDLFDRLTPAAQGARGLTSAIEQLRHAPIPVPLITDPVDNWLNPRTARALRAAGIKNLADLTVRIPRRKQWWVAIADLGSRGAKQVEAFFAAHPALTQRARDLISSEQAELVPWERLAVPQSLDGSLGTYRAPRETCALRARNDYEAVQAWMSLHESEATSRAYRKEAERLMLWAIVERGCALSSLTAEDGAAYRTLLRRPTPRGRWVGPARPRHARDWRPFAGDLTATSVSYALSVLNALFRWLIAQRYSLVNPFAGLKVRGGGRTGPLDASRAFTEGEWSLLRVIADGLEWTAGWSVEAAQRLRFILDFCQATGLRAGELVGCTLGCIRSENGGLRIYLVGKGSKVGKVAMPPQATGALDVYLVQRGLTTVRARWDPSTPILANLGEDGGPISASRLWHITKRFFGVAAESLSAGAPALAEKLRRASPHWMRHTHASHALANGADLTTVRDNLRHASISTTSVYLHGDDDKRSRQLSAVYQ